METFEKNFDPRKNDDPPFEMSKYSDIFSEKTKELLWFWEVKQERNI